MRNVRYYFFSKGMTWLEIMIVLVIIAIVGRFSLPLWREQRLASEDRALQLQLQSTIEYAQQQALLSHAAVGFCPTENGTHCSKTWGKEWLVFLIDEEASTPDVIKHVQVPVMHGRLFWRSYPRYRLHVLMSSHPTQQNDNGTLWHCHDQTIQWALTFNQSGVMRFVYPEEGQVALPGKPLLCS